jgi:UDP-N-acetyl-D-mannosaminuronic acid dehydrogenase
VISPDVNDAAELDLVVLGGGGHVGLPLSLAFAAAGLRVGVFDTNATTLEDLAAGRMPFRESGADALLQELLPTGRLVFDTSPSILGRTSHVVVVI